MSPPERKIRGSRFARITERDDGAERRRGLRQDSREKKLSKHGQGPCWTSKRAGTGDGLRAVLSTPRTYVLYQTVS